MGVIREIVLVTDYYSTDVHVSSAIALQRCTLPSTVITSTHKATVDGASPSPFEGVVQPTRKGLIQQTLLPV